MIKKNNTENTDTQEKETTANMDQIDYLTLLAELEHR